MKKVSILTLIFALLLALVSMPLSADGHDRWDGADDLDVNPLACGMGDEMMEDEGDDMEEEMEMMEYDGGMVSMGDDMAGMDITLVDVPKLVGIGYFAATTLGQQQAAEELGNVSVTTDAPTEANIDDQIQVIDNYITAGVDGILFAANDPVAISPVLRKALESGIHVVGYDANSEPDARQWFVNQAEFNGIAKSLIDSLVDQMGDDASFGIVTSTFTTPNQARWIAEMWAYPNHCYPDLEWLETLESAGRRRLELPAGADADQQVWRGPGWHLRHDFGRHARQRRCGEPGGSVRGYRRRWLGHAQRHEALCQ